MKKISSPQNLFVKELLKLQEKSRERKKKGLFLIEGNREIKLASKGGYRFKTILFCEKLVEISAIKKMVSTAAEYIKITEEVYQKLAYRETTEGIVALVEAKDFSLEKIHFKNKTPLVLIAEGIEKPGNIGALLRTADAAQVDAVFIANPKTDLYNPNVIRASIGCVFTNQIAMGTSEEIMAFLKEHSIHIYSATLQNSNAYHKENYTKASAIVVGTEATGLTQIWREIPAQNIYIPMQGIIDSMNVSVAAAVILFEAKRQRGF